MICILCLVNDNYMEAIVICKFATVAFLYIYIVMIMFNCYEFEEDF